MNGDVTMSPGTDLRNWTSRAACESALVDETDFGYTAGWSLRSVKGNMQLVYEQASTRSVMQCFPVYDLDAGVRR
jgi:hypothetical protein